jgi:2-aminoethylphosphonate-pyruvate transaminase
MEVVKSVKRNVLLNPGPATTTDTVKYAQVVPDICPREEEFVGIMDEIRNGLVKVVHADPEKFMAVLFTGSGTIIQDALVNSLVPEGKKICIVNNGAYSARMVEIACYYNIPCVNLEFPTTGLPDLDVVKQTLEHCRYDFNLRFDSSQYRRRKHRFLYVLGPEGALRHDRCFLDRGQY